MSVFALVDANNFYASCERVFAPRLVGKPVIVLSNNDGCVIARSNEAKALGIKMGVPFFEIEALVRRHRVHVFSSNYALYGDMSMRVMGTLGYLCPDVEVYSIDEAFLDLGGVPDRDGFARRARRYVRQWTGIPVSIGVGPTKTLSKVANRFAKKVGTYEGVFDLTAGCDLDGLLDQVAVSDIWGIGPRYTRLLGQNHIFTARQLRDACDRWVRQHLTIVGLRTVYELRGISCIPLDAAQPAKKGILCSRSFREPVKAAEDLKEAIATFAARAAEKLRRQDSVAGVVYVFVTTKEFGPGPHYTNHATATLPTASSYTPDLIRYAHRGLEAIFRPGYAYKKAGVMLRQITPNHAVQGDLFAGGDGDEDRRQALMDVVDAINRQWGRDAIVFGASGLKRPWAMKQAQRSPRYTTRWAELLAVRA
jgi:DNA polymerase V